MSASPESNGLNRVAFKLDRYFRNPSVVLHAPQPSLDRASRIDLSLGTCPASSVDCRTPPYVSSARVPVPQWRNPTTEETAFLWSAEAPPPHCSVGVVRLLGAPLLRLLVERKDELGRSSESESVRHPMVKIVLDAAAKAGIAAHHVYSARIGHDQPGLVTMTRAVDQDARIGLHFDRWDRLGVDDLTRASNRVSVNLGPSDRYFVFLNHTASAMASMLMQRGLSPVPRDVRDIGGAFMAAFPQYPIVRLRLRPGEAYLAPTENILHDGTSAEVTAANSYLSMRGHFGFAAV